MPGEPDLTDTHGVPLTAVHAQAASAATAKVRRPPDALKRS
jgi:hypothetical protein